MLDLHGFSTSQPVKPMQFQPLQGFRILSLALNLPGPAALQRCQQLGAVCRKLEPPAGDPMQLYSPAAYAEMHQQVAPIHIADLKTESGQALLHSELAQADLLLTSFRPSVLPRLGLDWATLQKRHPALSHVALIGNTGAAAEKSGHDVIYMAENGLINQQSLPLTLFADMAGSLQVVQAVLGIALVQSQQATTADIGNPKSDSGIENRIGNVSGGNASGGNNDCQQATGLRIEVALSEAAHYLAQPLRWVLTSPGAVIGGGHAGYQVSRCRDGRVVLAALEPHFAARLCSAAGLAIEPSPSAAALLALMQSPQAHSAITQWLQSQTCAKLKALATQADLPLHVLPD